MRISSLAVIALIQLMPAATAVSVRGGGMAQKLKRNRELQDRKDAFDRTELNCDLVSNHPEGMNSLDGTNFEYWYAMGTKDDVDSQELNALETKLFHEAMQSGMVWCTSEQRDGVPIGGGGRNLQVSPTEEATRKLFTQRARELGIIAVNSGPPDSFTDHECPANLRSIKAATGATDCKVITGRMRILAHDGDDVSYLVASLRDAIEKIMANTVAMVGSDIPDIAFLTYLGDSEEEAVGVGLREEDPSDTSGGALIVPGGDSSGSSGGGAVVVPGGDSSGSSGGVVVIVPGGDSSGSSGGGVVVVPGGDSSGTGGGNGAVSGGDSSGANGDGTGTSGGDSSGTNGGDGTGTSGGDSSGTSGDGTGTSGGDSSGTDGSDGTGASAGDSSGTGSKGWPVPGGNSSSTDGLVISGGVGSDGDRDIATEPDDGDTGNNGSGSGTEDGSTTGNGSTQNGDSSSDGSSSETTDTGTDTGTDNGYGGSDSGTEGSDPTGTASESESGTQDDGTGSSGSESGNGDRGIDVNGSVLDGDLDSVGADGNITDSTIDGSTYINGTGIAGELIEGDDDDDDDDSVGLILGFTIPLVVGLIAAALFFQKKRDTATTASAGGVRAMATSDYVLVGTGDAPSSFHEGLYHYTRDGTRYLSTRCEGCLETRRNCFYTDNNLGTIMEEEEFIDTGLGAKTSTMDVHVCTSAICRRCSVSPENRTIFIPSPCSPINTAFGGDENVVADIHMTGASPRASDHMEV